MEGSITDAARGANFGIASKEDPIRVQCVVSLTLSLFFVLGNFKRIFLCKTRMECNAIQQKQRAMSISHTLRATDTIQDRKMDMMRDDDGDVDIPEGMDPSDARVAIKLLYGADQTYRSALHDFTIYEREEKPFDQMASEEEERGMRVSESKPLDSVAVTTRRKRLRRSGKNNNNTRFGDESRSGRITHLHVTGIASMFLPSWDLCFSDVVKLDRLVSLKLNGCDSVPSEIFFDLPHLRSLWLINCQELTDPAASIASHKRRSEHHRKNSKIRSSTIERLDVRGGGLWGQEFLSAVRLLLPWMSPTLKSLSLSHTPYTSCYNNNNNKYATNNDDSIYGIASDETDEVSERLRQQRIEDKMLRQMRFHESMGKLLLDALLLLARGLPDSGICSAGNVADSSSPLEYLSLSFFNSLQDRDVASLVLDVIPEFAQLTTLHLPHHTISNLQIAARRISQQQNEYKFQPDKVLVSSPRLLRSSCLSWRIEGNSSSSSSSIPQERHTSVASVSRLRRLWLKPTLKNRAANNTDGSEDDRDDNRDDKAILASLLSHFPELGCVARSSNHRGYLYSPCPCCWRCCPNQPPTTHCEATTTNQTIEHLLRMNHAGRCLLEGLDDKRKPSCPPPVWPLVLERAWRIPPPDFCASSEGPAKHAGTIFRLLREGPIFSQWGIP
jgi:hypothetical protein